MPRPPSQKQSAVKKATRFEALEPIRQGVKERFGAFSACAADGLKLRHDHGGVYMREQLDSGAPELSLAGSGPPRLST
jgi:hypothetical protein